MKRIIIILIILAATSVAGNAQFFVEGNFGVDYIGSKVDEDRQLDISALTFNFSPQMGYWLNDHIAVGTRVTISKANAKSISTDLSNAGVNVDQESKTSSWRLSAFSRYKLWKTGKFSLLLDGSVYYEERDFTATSEAGITVTSTSNAASRIGGHVFPAITYNLNEKIIFIVICDFLSMELYSENNKIESTNAGSGKSRTNHFGFNTQSTFFKSLADISIGFIYNF